MLASPSNAALSLYSGEGALETGMAGGSSDSLLPASSGISTEAGRVPPQRNPPRSDYTALASCKLGHAGAQARVFRPAPPPKPMLTSGSLEMRPHHQTIRPGPACGLFPRPIFAVLKIILQRSGNAGLQSPRLALACDVIQFGSTACLCVSGRSRTFPA
jgi:hypothetical protein